MVLQSNRRLRNARSNDGKAYKMGNVTYHGAGNKAGTGRNTGRPYNLHFLEACCKKLEPVVVPPHQEFVKVFREMLARVKEMRVRAGAMNGGDDVMDVKLVEGILVNHEFERTPFVAAVPNAAEILLQGAHAANVTAGAITALNVAANTDATDVLQAARDAMVDVDAVAQQGNGDGTAGNAAAVVEKRGKVTTMLKAIDLLKDIEPLLKKQLKKEFDDEKKAVDAANTL